MRRQQLILLLTGLSVTSTLLIGLATNAASADGTWPGWLQPIQDDPWIAMCLVGLLTLAISVLLVNLTAESPPPPAVVGPAHGSDAEQTPVAVLRSLPRDTLHFVDRRSELERMTAAVDRATTPGGGLPVQAVNGMAGVGKTTLAVRLGHLLAPRFPDGQLFVNLDGHTPGRRPVRPQDALASLLLLMGVPPQRLPTDVDVAQEQRARSALWRSLLVDKRMLVVLDNAAGYEQVEPLVPGASGCLVLVTSRRRIAELEDINMTMEVLTVDDAVALFTELAARPSSDLDPEQARRLVDMSGRLPLAISLLGARFRQHTSWSLADLLRRLGDEHRRLQEMRAGDRAVAAAFDLSYADLPPERQQFFLHLGVFPGPTIGIDTAAALAGLERHEAEAHLDGLFDENLIEEERSGSYRFHDLLRRYCHDLAARLTPDERAATLDRAYAFYTERAERADQAISRMAMAEAQDTLDAADRDQALTWMEHERVNILACVDRARDDGRHDVATILSLRTAADLLHTGPWDQAEHVFASGLDSARTVDDAGAEARLLFNLGILHRYLARYDTARADLERASELFEAGEEAVPQAFALNHLGIVLYLLADYGEAKEVQDRSLAVASAAGNEQGRANALHDLGMVLRETARYGESEEAQSTALDIFRSQGDRYGEANALRALGVVNAVQGKFALARARQDEALSLYQRVGDRLHVAYALNEKGAVLRTVGDLPGAEVAHQDALDIFRVLGDGFGEATSLRNLGMTAAGRGDGTRAEALFDEALTIFGSLGSRGGEAATRRELASTLGRSGRAGDALDLLATAHSVQVVLHDRLGQVETLNAWGEVLLGAGRPDDACARFGEALDLAEDIGCPLEIARALVGLGGCPTTTTTVSEPVRATDLDPATARSRAQEIYTALDMARPNAPGDST